MKVNVPDLDKDRPWCVALNMPEGSYIHSMLLRRRYLYNDDEGDDHDTVFKDPDWPEALSYGCGYELLVRHKLGPAFKSLNGPVLSEWHGTGTAEESEPGYSSVVVGSQLALCCMLQQMGVPCLTTDLEEPHALELAADASYLGTELSDLAYVLRSLGYDQVYMTDFWIMLHTERERLNNITLGEIDDNLEYEEDLHVRVFAHNRMEAYRPGWDHANLPALDDMIHVPLVEVLATLRVARGFVHNSDYLIGSIASFDDFNKEVLP